MHPTGCTEVTDTRDYGFTGNTSLIGNASALRTHAAGYVRAGRIPRSRNPAPDVSRQRPLCGVMRYHRNWPISDLPLSRESIALRGAARQLDAPPRLPFRDL